MSRTECSNGSLSAAADAATTAELAPSASRGCESPYEEPASLCYHNNLTDVHKLERVEETAPTRRSSLHDDVPRDQISPPPAASIMMESCDDGGVASEREHEGAGANPSSHLSPNIQALESPMKAHSGSENMMVVEDAAKRRSSSRGAASSPAPSASSRGASPDGWRVPSPRLTSYATLTALAPKNPSEQSTLSGQGESQEDEERRGRELRSFQKFQVPNPPDLPQHPSHADWIAASDHSTTSSIKKEVNDKPYQCDDCGKAFARKSDLLRHSHIHSNLRQPLSPFVCSFPGCKKDFIQRSALTVHFRVHTGERPHVCAHPSCGKAFSDSSSLTRHRKTHTGAKPFQCDVPDCGKRFCRKITLTKHVRREHVPGGRLPHYPRGGSVRRKYRGVPYSRHQGIDDSAHHIRSAERLLGWASRPAAADDLLDPASGKLERGNGGVDVGQWAEKHQGGVRTKHLRGARTGAEDHGCSRESTLAFEQSPRQSQALPEYDDQSLSPYGPPSVGTPGRDPLSQQVQESAFSTSCAVKPVHPQLASLLAFYMESLGTYPQQGPASIDYESRAAMSHQSTSQTASSSSSFSSSCDTMDRTLQDRHDGHEHQLPWPQSSHNLQYHGGCDGLELSSFNTTLPLYPSPSLPQSPSAELSQGSTPTGAESFRETSDAGPTFRRYPTWPPSVKLKVHSQIERRSSTHFYGDNTSSQAPAWTNPTLGPDAEESRTKAIQSNVLGGSSPPFSFYRGLWTSERRSNGSTRRLSTIPLPEADSS
ncbi:BQ2448_2500 [Microbotryum intermedium]|uniref:BQ2448_2500 protein n=1 Tax=Microbotryum intermedium TaxID=269621 RepID=A0A238F6I6_9BASI|nr:BQ2448_2500 [Microbotryum intermedium]